MMITIVGLGNIGQQYHGSRHNVGFLAVDRLGTKLNCVGWVKKKYYQFCQANLASDQLVRLVKPSTFVNSSGKAVLELVNGENTNLDDLWILLDDINVPLGSFRVRAGGASGGHNGLKSIIECLGSGNFKRIRIGIGVNQLDTDLNSSDDHQDNLSGFVLSKFTKGQQVKINQVVDAVTDYMIASMGQVKKIEAETLHV